MKIGILRETKIPEDNRVIMTPKQIKDFSLSHPSVKFIVQSSPIRAYSDDEYIKEGIEVRDSVEDCDLLIGIKEAAINTIIPDKHYIFFGHIAKKQEYNKPLFRKLIDSKITFTDYEYLVDNKGQRLMAFSWYAGIVGVYYTLLGWGKKTGAYELPKPHQHFTIQEIIDNLKGAKLKKLKIVITGTGRVSKGVQAVLNGIGAKELQPAEFLEYEGDKLCFTVLPLEKMVADKGNMIFDREEFFKHPENYKSIIKPFTKEADILISGHFWREIDPVYIDKEDVLSPNFKIKMIGDITCDIQGSIKTTLRSSTHADPFYDYNPKTGQEEEAFKNPENLTVMAVDTCPNALPREASEFFGDKFVRHFLIDFMEKKPEENDVLQKGTILKKGELTKTFEDLTDYIKTF